MLTKKELAEIGERMVELVLEARSRREKRKLEYPLIDIWGPAYVKGRAREDGVFLTQDDDEIWLSPDQARRLIEDLKKYYPEKK